MRNISFRLLLPTLCVLTSVPSFGAEYNRILVPPFPHPAIVSAAQIIAKKLSLPLAVIRTNSEAALPARGDIVLVAKTEANDQSKLLNRSAAWTTRDGYTAVFKDGGALIFGARPRSLLFAAGDTSQWQDKTTGTFVREPAFAIRAASYVGDQPVPEYAAELGVNVVVGGPLAIPTFKNSLPEIYNQLSLESQTALEQRSREAADRAATFAAQCRDADVAYYPFLYGNDFRRWSPVLYDAVIKAYPSVAGKPAPSSWEKATLCPSDPKTWKIVEAYVRELVEQSGADGLCVTFWDDYGMYCQCERCVQSGLNKFPNQLYECVKHIYAAIAPLDKRLIVRTWSSGVPHWLDDQWVHAPGYGDFGGSSTELWARVIKELPPDIILQTKVYNADCQPDAPFSTLLGNGAPHTEIAEYQIAGRFYFPASVVDHTFQTMRKTHGLVSLFGGVSIFPGGAGQIGYDFQDDIINSINVHAWREFSWDVNKDPDAIWTEWAVPIYGERAAPHVINALKLSENATSHLFSTLGLGGDTTSTFPQTIKRRETLLKYTNRYYDPEYLKFLEPTRENIQRVIDQKTECLKIIDQMFAELELARPYLRKEQAGELSTRFGWLREYAIINRHLEESFWRYRYLRHLTTLFETETEQMKFLGESYDAVKEHKARLFQFDPAQKFSCYNVPLGQLPNKPSLGDPMPLMRELYDESRKCIEEIVGPDYLPAQLNR